MGRQIHFYMLGNDLKDFLEAVQSDGDIVLARESSDSPEISPVEVREPVSAETLCLWNQRILPVLTRKWIPDPGYYRIDTLHQAVLEMTPSFRAEWLGRPALGQGRLFGNFEAYLGKPRDFERWYERLVRWIRKHYRKSPATSGGFVGPMAYEFYSSGAFLLPNFLPPPTNEWVAEIGKQHARSTPDT